MSQRLLGFLLIVRALVPILIVLVIYWAYTQIVDDLRVVLRPMAAIESEMAALNDTLETAQAQFDTARTHAEDAIAVIQGFQVPNLLPSLPANLTLPSLNIPDVTVPIVPTLSVRFTSVTGSITNVIEGACSTVLNFFGIPSTICEAARTVTEPLNFSYPSGLTFGTTSYTIDFPAIPSFTVPMPAFFNTLSNQLEGVFSTFDDIFDSFDRVFSEISTFGQTIRTLPGNVNRMMDSTTRMIDSLNQVAANYATLLMLATGAVIILLVVVVAGSFVQNIGRGLRLLFGPST
ncbi:MAG: hypothetical protein CL610_21225 [Anaerolineaceae bacterium]|nr:hypothetical protein [Anaerolineaceae bacterium]